MVCPVTNMADMDTPSHEEFANDRYEGKPELEMMYKCGTPPDEDLGCASAAARAGRLDGASQARSCMAEVPAALLHGPWRACTACVPPSKQAMLATVSDCQWRHSHYLPPGQDRRHPHASPLFAKDLSGLPPAFVLTAEVRLPLGSPARQLRRGQCTGASAVDRQAAEQALHALVHPRARPQA